LGFKYSLHFSSHKCDQKSVKRILLGKSPGKIQVQRLECKWKDNTKTDFREMGHEGAD
jgi:hypothetical protein